MAVLRKILGILVCTALILTAPGLDFYRACATTFSHPSPALRAPSPASGGRGEADPAAVRKFWERLAAKDTGHKLDCVGEYLFGAEGELTPLGQYVGRYLELRQDPRKGFNPHVAAGVDDEIAKAFEGLCAAHNAGRRIDQKRAAVDALAKRLEQMGLDSAQSAYAAISQMMTVLTGAKQAGGPDPDRDMQVFYEDGNSVYYDDQGRVFGVVDEYGRILRTREVEDLQIDFNRKHIKGAPTLRVTGQLDLPTLLAPFWEFRDQMGRFDRGFHYDRTVALAEILHKDRMYRGDQFDPLIQERERREKVQTGKADAKTLEQELEDKRAGGSRFLARQLLDPAFEERAVYLKKAEIALREFVRAAAVELAGVSTADPRLAKIEAMGPAELEAFLNTLSGRRVATPEVKQRLEQKRGEVGRLLTAAYLAGEKYHLKHARYRLFTKDMDDLIDKVPGPLHEKILPDLLHKHLPVSQDRARVDAQRGKLAARLDAVRAQVSQMLGQLDQLSLNVPSGSRLADVQARLDALNSYLGAVDSQNRQVQEDLSTFATTLGLYTESAKISDGTRDMLQTAWQATWFRHAYNAVVSKVAPHSERAAHLRTISRGTERLSTGYAAVVDGDFATAKKQLRWLVGDAFKQDFSAPLFGSAGGGPSAAPGEEDKLAASVSAYSRLLQQQAKEDFLIDLTGQMLQGGLLAMAAAPALSEVLTTRGTQLIGASLEMGIHGGKTARALAPLARALGETMVNSGTLFSNLSSTKWVPGPLAAHERATILFNALRMEAAVGANLGGISGVMQWGKHKIWTADSPYRSSSEAFWEGAKGGAKFVAENPWILYVGLPTNVFGRGNVGSRIVSNFGESGAVGGLTRTASNAFKADYDPVMRFAGRAQDFGWPGAAVSFFTVTTDQVAKYYIGAEVMGRASRYFMNWVVDPVWGNGLEPWRSGVKDNGRRRVLTEAQVDAARARLDRAERAALFTMNWGWLLIPSAPAQGGAARRDQLLAEDGFRQFQADKKLHELVNGEDQTRALDLRPSTSFVDWAFGRHQERGPAKEREFKISAEMDQRAIREVLPEIIAPAKEAAQSMSKADIVKQGLRELFEYSQADTANQELRAIGPKDGSWTIRLTDKVRDQALSVFESQALQHPTQALELMRDGKMDASLRQAIAEIFLRTHEGGAFDSMLKLAEVQLQLHPDGGLFRRSLKAAETRLGNRYRSGDGFYMGLLRGVRSLVPFTKSHAAARDIVTEARTVLKDHLRTEELVNAKGEGFVVKVRALETPSKAYGERLDALKTRTAEWREAMKKDPDGPGFSSVIEPWKQGIEADAALSKGEKEALGALADYVTALGERFQQAEIRDAKGHRITAFRPKQTQVLVEFLNSVAGAGQAGSGRVIRKYLLLATGGGKTLLAFEGILPVAKADAKLKGKKLAYMTANSNLVAQARVDYKAFKKLLTKLEIITMDEFTTRVAKGRFMGGDRPEDYWLLADELDKMAEDAVKTIGQESTRVGRENDVYRGLLNLSLKMKGVVDILGRTPEPGLGAQAKRLLRALLGDAVGAVQSSAELGAKARGDLRALRSEHHALLEQAEGKQDVARLRALIDGLVADAEAGRLDAARRKAGEYRKLLPRTVESANPLYEVYRQADQEIGRWMESPLRATNDLRLDWVEDIRNVGQEARGLARLQGKELARRARELSQRQEQLLSRSGPAFRIRDAAKAAELKAVLQQIAAAAAKGDKAQAAQLAQKHGELVPEAVVATDWVQAFEKRLTGMTKDYAARLRLAVERDAHLTHVEKGKFLAEFEYSEKQGKGWVYNELVNLAYGHVEDPALVRFDGQAKRVHVVHPEWFENMDTPTRRHWELHYGADLTMPYEHRAKATVRDLTSNLDANLVAFSGTKQDMLKLEGMDVLGEATPRRDAYSHGFNGVSSMYRLTVRRILSNLKSATKLTFVGFSNTRELKLIKKALRKAGVKPEEIATVFSDTEFLRTQRPESNVITQMNLGGLKTGKVKVVLFDMRIGGRGLDLDFKSFGAILDADKRVIGYEDGKGYREVEMMILNPDKVSPVHYVQFQGRIAPDRLLGGGKNEPTAKASYFNLIDMAQAGRNRETRAMARKQGGEPDSRFVQDRLPDIQMNVQKELLENSEAISRGSAGWKSGLNGLTK